MVESLEELVRKIEILEHQVAFLYKELDKINSSLVDVFRRLNELEKSIINNTLNSYKF